ncbi:XF1762 family protein [Paenibacillus sp. FSL K6-3166]|uniref:XF1762 family protein n=1 Tax=Paenibacillus sp. FSL K6-3166 TaxID=2921492 RepID=UPI0030F694A2
MQEDGVICMWYWLFINQSNSFIVLSEEQLRDEGRWNLEEENFELISDSFKSIPAAEDYAHEYYGAKKIRLRVRPISLKDAQKFVDQEHRHHIAPQGHKFSIGLTDGHKILGVIIAGRPVSRHQDNGLTLEVTRCCVRDVYKNGISILYAAACRVAKAMGYTRVITYTLASENGASMRASNFTLERSSEGGSWGSKSRKRTDKHPTMKKNLWVREVS